MVKSTVEVITWDYDLKRILLNDDNSERKKNYDRINPIKNILMGKDKKYYQDIPGQREISDYYKGNRGDVENYKIVECIFQKTNTKTATNHKDIMNSFWTTYKSILQIEYPEIFMLERVFKTRKLVELKDPNVGSPLTSINYPPYTNSEIGVLYSKAFQTISIAGKELNAEPKDSWIDFLLKNFDYFIKVHKNDKYIITSKDDSGKSAQKNLVEEFAKLTHTIGNIAVVPLGFNAGRYTSTQDYWDISLLHLYDFLYPINAWDSFIEHNFMQPFVCKKTKKPAELWLGHSKTNIKIESVDQYKDFLWRLSKSIEERGKYLIKKVNDEIEDGEMPKYADELWNN